MAADIGVRVQRAVVRDEDRLAVEVQDRDAIGLIQAEIVQAAQAGPLVPQHLALAGETACVDIVLPGESGFHSGSMPSD